MPIQQIQPLIDHQKINLFGQNLYLWILWRIDDNSHWWQKNELWRGRLPVNVKQRVLSRSNAWIRFLLVQNRLGKSLLTLSTMDEHQFLSWLMYCWWIKWIFFHFYILFCKFLSWPWWIFLDLVEQINILITLTTHVNFEPFDWLNQVCRFNAFGTAAPLLRTTGTDCLVITSFLIGKNQSQKRSWLIISRSQSLLMW